MIIAFGHKKQQGKDTAVQAIIEHVRKKAIFGNQPNPYAYWVSFAQPLYEVCHTLIPEFETKEHYDNHPEDKEVPIPRLGKSPRKILIDIGQTLKTVLGPDCFAVPIANINFKKPDVLLISDLRFPCEVTTVKQKGGICVKVVRPGSNYEGDDVDNALNEWDGWDYTLVNDGTLEEFQQKAVELYERIIKG